MAQNMSFKTLNEKKNNCQACNHIGLGWAGLEDMSSHNGYGKQKVQLGKLKKTLNKILGVTK